MSDNDSSQEKTEEATPKRQEKAKEDGQIPRSKELTTSAVLLSGTVGLYLFGGHISDKLLHILRYNFSLTRESIFDPQTMLSHLGSSFGEALNSLIPLFSILLVAAIVGPIGLGGWMFSTKSLAPKADRISPIAGLKRMFSAKSMVELVKSIGKIFVVVALTFLTLSIYKHELLALANTSLEGSIQGSLDISVLAAIIISASTLFIALIDIPFQIWENSKKLKMSKQDIKDEMKDSEGKPEVKGRIRQLQQEMANKRMMSAVPEADVIITNPSHYSLALKYDPETMDTPILLAKGVDHAAFKIRDIAKEHKIDIIRSPVLARAIYHNTEVDGPIPGGLFLAVAQVLAYVFQLRNFRTGSGDRPDFPTGIQVPKDMQAPF